MRLPHSRPGQRKGPELSFLFCRLSLKYSNPKKRVLVSWLRNMFNPGHKHKHCTAVITSTLYAPSFSTPAKTFSRHLPLSRLFHSANQRHDATYVQPITQPHHPHKHAKHPLLETDIGTCRHAALSITFATKRQMLDYWRFLVTLSSAQQCSVAT